MQEEGCWLNLGGNAFGVKEEFFSMNLPDLSTQGLGTPTLFSYEGHIPPLEINVYTSIFQFGIVFYSLNK